jgi:hypothetical protein
VSLADAIGADVIAAVVRGASAESSSSPDVRVRGLRRGRDASRRDLVAHEDRFVCAERSPSRAP